MYVVAVYLHFFYYLIFIGSVHKFKLYNKNNDTNELVTPKNIILYIKKSQLGDGHYLEKTTFIRPDTFY